MIIFISSFLWLITMKNKKHFTVLFPIFYMLVALVSYFSEAFLVLKLMPLFISSFFMIAILVSYLQHNSLILYFAQKYMKDPISEEEKVYIHHSTLFWFFVSLLNVGIHLMAFLETKLEFWLYYSSIGWYFLFLFAGLLQFLHRKYVFLRKKHA